MSSSRKDDPTSTDGLDSWHTLPKFSSQENRSTVSSPGSASEQSEMHNTSKAFRLSRRATFAPGVAEGLDDSAMQPLLLHLPTVAKQPSIPKQPSVIKQSSFVKQSNVVKQSSVIKQSSMAKQSSIPKQSSMHKQPSVASQARSVSQTSTPRGKSADLSRPVSLSSKKSMETDKISAQRSSSILQSRKSLQSMKTAKIDDMLDEYKFAVEQKAKPAEVHAGQHALQLDAAMQKLTLDWIVQSTVSLSQSYKHTFCFIVLIMVNHSYMVTAHTLLFRNLSSCLCVWVQCIHLLFSSSSHPATCRCAA